MMYLVLKALHIIAMVAWFAGLFYLPRLFVYQVEHPEAAPTLQLMQKKLATVIMGPAAIATLVTGMLVILTNPAVLTMGWFHIKMVLVLGLFGYHGSLEHFRKGLANGTNTRSGKFFRMYNEVPTLVLFAVVLLAVVKPF
jgi:putative membrane protein